MSSKTVIIRSESCGSDECIVTYVNDKKNGEVKVKNFYSIEFTNELGEDYPVSAYFYKVADEKILENAIADFCKNKPSKPFVITEDKKCKMYKYTGEYNYTLETTSVYEALDPVIIIEESYWFFSPPGIGAIIAVLVIILGFAFSRLRKKGA